MNTEERIFALLDEMGMEQQIFAENIGTNKHVVSKWRTGQLKSYQKYLPKIAEVLGTSVDYLLGTVPFSAMTVPEVPVYKVSNLLRLLEAYTETEFDALLAAVKGATPMYTAGNLDDTDVSVALAYHRADEGTQSNIRKLLDVEISPSKKGESAG